MNMKNWNGVWINTGKTMLTPSPEVGRAPYLRKTFSCSSNPRKATVSLCGLGWHELYVNGKKVDIPSYSCKPGDVIEVRDRTSSRQLAQRALDESQLRAAPAWIDRVDDAFRGTINRLPIRDEMDKTINEQLIVEFYSR